jgi:prevent-host-death family protein
MADRVVSVTEFKAKCLSFLDEIGSRGGTLTITKRGRPLATVQRAKPAKWGSSEGALAGKVIVPDDLHKIDTSHLWECLNEQPKRRKR